MIRARRCLLPLVAAVGLSLSPVAQAETAKEIAQEAFPSVVMLVMLDAHGQPLTLASGFFVQSDVVSTNYHVLQGAASGHARVVGRKKQYDIVGYTGLDEQHDLALLKLKNINAPTLAFGDSSSVAVGDRVYAVGNPLGLEGTFSEGIVSGVRLVEGGEGEPHVLRWHFEYDVDVTKEDDVIVAERDGVRLAVRVIAEGKTRRRLYRDAKWLGSNPLRPGTPAPWVWDVAFGGTADDAIETRFEITKRGRR